MFCMFSLMCFIVYDILIKNLRAYQASDTNREDSFGVVLTIRIRVGLFPSGTLIIRVIDSMIMFTRYFSLF